MHIMNLFDFNRWKTSNHGEAIVRRNGNFRKVKAGDLVDCFKDEEDPAKYWPAEVLKGNVEGV